MLQPRKMVNSTTALTISLVVDVEIIIIVLRLFFLVQTKDSTHSLPLLLLRSFLLTRLFLALSFLKESLGGLDLVFGRHRPGTNMSV